MDSTKEIYLSPFSTRYASKEMQAVFSEGFKFRTWRKLWIALAKAEKALGLEITDEQISELESFKDDINFEVAEAREKVVRHDVMSHVFAYGQQCPKAEPIIHLGATSCYVGDNTDVIILKEASHIILKKAAQVVKNLSEFADNYKNLPCLAYTHLQPAQLTTVGKRATLWIYELCQDIHELEHRLEELLLLGSKGTTGTQASFMELFEGDEEKIKKMEEMIALDMGFKGCVPVSGQTYSRKVDAYFLSVLSGFAQSAYKFSNDMRILQSFEEMEEPFEKNQIGSSAMPYKRNPMRSERISALARYVIVDSLNPALTAGTQWFERTLDDSANKRISSAEAFLAIDSILNIYMNVTAGLVVYDKVVERRVMEKLPFMATENIMMKSVKKGGNRQELHELLRTHSHAAAAKVKLEGGKNDLIERIAEDDAFPLTLEEIKAELDPSLYIGRSASQVDEFIKEIAQPIIAKWYEGEIEAELKV
ncbi:adenylosuccinate lyase [Anaerotignum propionicum]|uniref:Adenylosuccinate lyase n=1 Tax=Anaerotignum propionicum DSM 1682 TaxID=991789 RepID=A0A110A7C4_ANAPI|nr:adenylosuccinate lyase [Anaerotignum propionicum]AMJ41916.1 adenylosuccinate lyase [Anaerotignum propionicum DSM 1682]SHE95051.1 adenylosuccinate lyase [[Clostridium] propionicum DSM 1682] [Anaerotignum propionicum DSM 1682]